MENNELHIGNNELPRGSYIKTKMQERPNEKKIIAEYVTKEYIKDFDAVLLDAGSTAEMIAVEMFTHKKFLSILTNNMGAYAAYVKAKEINTCNTGILEESANLGNELLISGGRYVDVYESLLGEGAIASIKAFTPNVIILGTSGLRCEEGIFCHGSEESAIKKLLWEKPTDIRLIATDWSKIGKRDAHAFAPIEQLSVNAKKAVVVTCRPGRDIWEENKEKMKEFDHQIEKMKKYHIDVVTLSVDQAG